MWQICKIVKTLYRKTSLKSVISENIHNSVQKWHFWHLYYLNHVLQYTCLFCCWKNEFSANIHENYIFPPLWFIDAQISTVVANKNSRNFRFLYGIFWNFAFLCFPDAFDHLPPPPQILIWAILEENSFMFLASPQKLNFFSNNFVQNVKLKMDNFEAVKSHRTDNISGILSYWFQFEGGVAKWSNASGKVKKWQKYKWNLENSVIIVNF